MLTGAGGVTGGVTGTCAKELEAKRNSPALNGFTFILLSLNSLRQRKYDI
jgi:hypothetical protein